MDGGNRKMCRMIDSTKQMVRWWWVAVWEGGKITCGWMLYVSMPSLSHKGALFIFIGTCLSKLSIEFITMVVTAIVTGQETGV